MKSKKRADDDYHGQAFLLLERRLERAESAISAIGQHFGPDSLSQRLKNLEDRIEGTLWTDLAAKLHEYGFIAVNSAELDAMLDRNKWLPLRRVALPAAVFLAIGFGIGLAIGWLI
jgi:hypothetical protein